MNLRGEATLLHVSAMLWIGCLRVFVPCIGPADCWASIAFAAFGYLVSITEAIADRRTGGAGNVLCWLLHNLVFAAMVTYFATLIGVLWHVRTMEVTLAFVGAVAVAVITNYRTTTAPRKTGRRATKEKKIKTNRRKRRR
jgi:uncharacterized membrane protein (GlpM family)